MLGAFSLSHVLIAPSPSLSLFASACHLHIPVTVAFPGIPLHFRHLIPTVAGRIGTVVPGSLVTGVGTPRIQVWALQPQSIQIWWSSFGGSLPFVSGFLSLAARTSAFGARPSATSLVTVLVLLDPDPPDSSLEAQPRPPPAQRQQQQTAPQLRVPQQQRAAPSVGEEGWRPVDRRHRFRGSRSQDSPFAPEVPRLALPASPLPLSTVQEEGSQADLVLSLVPASTPESLLPAPPPLFAGFGAMDTESQGSRLRLPQLWFRFCPLHRHLLWAGLSHSYLWIVLL